jgi:hypothetical protein
VARRASAPPAFEYVATEHLGTRAHVIVDGAPRPGTALTLSHWPGTPTPKELWADLSAEIVLKARADGRVFPGGVQVATIDHYDVDGVVALGFLVADGVADAHGPLLVEAARVGDFDVVNDDRAALVAFALGALSPRPGQRGRSTSLPEATAAALDLLPSLAQRPEAYESLWGAEATAYRAACGALSGGAVMIEELPGLDLALVTVERASAIGPARWGDAALHRGAVHSATACLRVATLTEGRYEVRFRYESWVRLTTRRPRPRVDLAPLAATLSAAEVGGARWDFEGAGAITPALRLVGDGRTSLEAGFFVDALCRYLEAADARPPAWDRTAEPSA